MKTEIRKDLPIHYRYNDYAYEDGLKIKVTKFYPVGETKCFYLVVDECNLGFYEPKVRRVSKSALRSYCHSSMDDALYSYKKRKKAQIWHSEFALAKANKALSTLDDITIGVDSFDAGRPDFWDQLIFG